MLRLPEYVKLRSEGPSYSIATSPDQIQSEVAAYVPNTLSVYVEYNEADMYGLGAAHGLPTANSDVHDIARTATSTFIIVLPYCEVLFLVRASEGGPGLRSPGHRGCRHRPDP